MTLVSPRRGERGFTLIGLLFWAVLISVVAVVALRVGPTVNEYYTIQKAVDKIARTGGASVPEIRTAFERTKQVEYAISSISGKDLDITKQDDRVVIRFAYDKEVELFGPVYLLIKYRGQSK
jgi:type II secretory pathway pseudopilin PulG